MSEVKEKEVLKVKKSEALLSKRRKNILGTLTYAENGVKFDVPPGSTKTT